MLAEANNFLYFDYVI